jgi:mannose-6-phosphate isomerase-like protein (cupin superfamily)
MSYHDHPRAMQLEAYLLGELLPLEAQALEKQATQDPELAAALADLRATAEGLAHAAAKQPPAHLRARIFDTITELAREADFDLAHPPRITRYADASRWHDALRGLQPDDKLFDIPVRVLQDGAHVQQLVLWLEDTLIENPHDEDEFLESFLILSGTCRCQFGEKVFDLGPGDYIEVPPRTAHSIRNTSPAGSVMAVVQRLKAA